MIGRLALCGLAVCAVLVITTAAVPGRAAPRIIPASAVGAMRTGSVIVDEENSGTFECCLNSH